MNEWQAKYEALLMYIDDPELVDNAEKIVKLAYDISTTTALPMYQCWYYLIETVRTLQVVDTNKKPKLDGPTANAILETLRMPE